MATKFTFQFDSDSDQQAPTATSTDQPPQNTKGFLTTHSMVVKSEKKQKDKYAPNQIAKNQFFSLDDYAFGQDDKISSLSQVVQTSNLKNLKETGGKKPGARRKKGDAAIKLQPLNTLQLQKNIQKIDLVKVPDTIRGQDKKMKLDQQIQKDKIPNSVHRQNLLNFYMGSSSDEQKDQKEKKDVTKKNRNNHNKQNNLFFNQSDSEQQTTEKNGAQEKKSTSKEPDCKSNQAEEEKNEFQEKSSYKAQNLKQLNPQQQRSSEKPVIDSSNHPQSSNQLYPINLEQRTQFDEIKNLLVNTMGKNSVLNLKLRRVKTLFNFFSPEFRIQFAQDRYFLMNSKKTSSKPTSTFIFTGSETNFEEVSTKYLGKMKSNISGSIYNIFSGGLNPSDARARGIAPRQLLATVVYETQIFGTGRPKEFTVYVKKPDFSYYCDFRGVKMYEDEVPLNDLFNNFVQNRDKICIFHTRLAMFCKESKQYIMDFEGKVKMSSIKNFILQDRLDRGQKVMLFGKLTEDDYVMDVHHPLTPLVGIGVALTVFDSRIGSD